MSADNQSWERDIITEMARNYLKEQRRSRFWKNFFRFLFLLVFLFSTITTFSLMVGKDDKRNKPHTGVVDINGGIFDKSEASANNIATALRKAYKDKQTKGIILNINSPGGSPVQASFIFNEVRRLRKLHPDIPVYAVCTDMCASAAYYIAASADNIYADPSSLVGSIGVIYNGFGFVDAMNKVGVQRRMITAGINKGFMDPFSPLEPKQEQFLHKMLAGVHQEFIASVKAGRGKRLSSDPELFSGLIWSGRQAKALGLIDDFASPGTVAREIVKQEIVINYTKKDNVFGKALRMFGASVANQLTLNLGLQSPLK